ncbi:hypothetical protein A2U01_0055430, partial [Trifolium medium]|nr:hypothetical protein [Trifolium medium]
SIEVTPAPGIAKRLRSNTGRVVDTGSEPTKTTKVTRNTGKKPMYGPPRTWCKGVPPSEKKKKKKSLKRKEVTSSDSEFDVEEDAIATSGATDKGSSKKARTVPFVPVDNVSF